MVPSIVTDALVLLEMTSTVKNFGLFSCNFNWFERWCVWGIVCRDMSEAISEDHSKAACVQSIIIWIGNYYSITLLSMDAYIKLSFLKGRAKKTYFKAPHYSYTESHIIDSKIQLWNYSYTYRFWGGRRKSLLWGSEFIQNISGNRDNFFLFQGFQMRYTHGIWLYNIDLSTYALKGPHATYNFFPWFSYSQYTLIMMHC